MNVISAFLHQLLSLCVTLARTFGTVRLILALLVPPGISLGRQVVLTGVFPVTPLSKQTEKYSRASTSGRSCYQISSLLFHGEKLKIKQNLFAASDKCIDDRQLVSTQEDTAAEAAFVVPLRREVKD